MIIQVHYTRLGKHTSVFTEHLVLDDGRQLTSYERFDAAGREHMTRLFHESGLLAPPAAVAGIRKHYFYNEYFDVLEWLGPNDEVLGYYSDIATPLRKENGAYYLTDLFLDLWLVPGQPPQVLDEDEFEAGIAAGLLTAEWQTEARRAIARLRQESASGKYPFDYLR
jgi:hypothetical protein